MDEVLFISGTVCRSIAKCVLASAVSNKSEIFSRDGVSLDRKNVGSSCTIVFDCESFICFNFRLRYELLIDDRFLILGFSDIE